MTNVGVHQTHCCKQHGCKYGDSVCPVFSGEVIQDFPCETCSFAREEVEEILHEIFDFDMGGATSEAFYDGLKSRGLKLVKEDG